MNIIIPTLSIASIGIISSALNSLYILKTSLKNNPSYSGFFELKQFLNENDPETLLDSVKLIIDKLSSSSNKQIQKIIQSLLCTINEIEKELNEIQNRINYNNHHYLKIYPFIYKFHNAKIRLEILINKLNNQTENLIKTTSFLSSIKKSSVKLESID